MRVFVVCLLAVLGCSVAEGATVSKCELKEKLTDKLRDRAENSGLDVDKLMTNIVCHAEYAADFNTSAVNELTIADTGIVDSTVWTLYGLFQLSNHLVCNDSTTETYNICGMDCDELVDDDIEDDLGCLLTLFKHFVEDCFSSPYYEDLKTMIKLVVQDECKGVQPSEYFKECAV